MSSEDENNKGKLDKSVAPNDSEKPKFVKPTIKITVIEIDYEVHAQDTT